MAKWTAMVDVAVIGAGAAGLMAGIWAGRTSPKLKTVLLDSARTIGAKILVSGGGRCNVTHDEVDASAFAGSTPNAIRKVLRRFDVQQTTDFFRELGVKLKREETGKLFPVTDSARTVLDALLSAAKAANVELLHPRRVESVQKVRDGFAVHGDGGVLHASAIVLATGGKSLPKTGSDGHGYAIVRSLGHTTTDRVFPALVPLTLSRDHWLCGLSGLSTDATLEVQSGTGRRLSSFTGSVLCTHFGLSGPAVLDISRYYIDAKRDDPQCALVINWRPGMTPKKLDEELQSLGKITVLRCLRGQLPERLTRALCEQAGVDAASPGFRMTHEQRKKLARLITRMALPVTGDRGFSYAEVTAGGVPLSELNLNTMESRVCPGLYLCGEICDVDGRIGGFNFQWAWASGYVAGSCSSSNAENAE
jgi:hypothetical protein